MFVGVPADIVGIHFQWKPDEPKWEEAVISEIVYKVMARLGVE